MEQGYSAMIGMHAGLCCGLLKMPLFLLFYVLQDPEVMAAFQDVAQNPANMSKYQNNPKVMSLITKLSAKFGSKP